MWFFPFGWHHWFFWGFPFGGLGFLFLMIALAVLIARSPHRSGPFRARALDILEERYARGEIGRDEYIQKRKDILG